MDIGIRAEKLACDLVALVEEIVSDAIMDTGERQPISGELEARLAELERRVAVPGEEPREYCDEQGRQTWHAIQGNQRIHTQAEEAGDDKAS